jgi:hypothetical protein
MITTIQSELNAQQKMVADSLTRSFDELHAGEVRKDARKLSVCRKTA